MWSHIFKNWEELRNESIGCLNKAEEALSTKVAVKFCSSDSEFLSLSVIILFTLSGLKFSLLFFIHISVLLEIWKSLVIVVKKDTLDGYHCCHNFLSVLQSCLHWHYHRDVIKGRDKFKPELWVSGEEELLPITILWNYLESSDWYRSKALLFNLGRLWTCINKILWSKYQRLMEEW